MDERWYPGKAFDADDISGISGLGMWTEIDDKKQTGSKLFNEQQASAPLLGETYMYPDERPEAE